MPKKIQGTKQLGSCKLPPSPKFSSLESVERRPKGKKKFYVSADRSVYQQRIIKVNEKNYLIRTSPGWRPTHRSCSLPNLPALGLLCNAIHQSHFPAFLPSCGPPTLATGEKTSQRESSHRWTVVTRGTSGTPRRGKGIRGLYSKPLFVC